MGFYFEKFFFFEEFIKIELVSKVDLINNNKEIYIGIYKVKCWLVEILGIFGEVLVFLRNEEWDFVNRVLMMCFYDWYGVKLWDFNGYFWGYNIKFI